MPKRDGAKRPLLDHSEKEFGLLPLVFDMRLLNISPDRWERAVSSLPSAQQNPCKIIKTLVTYQDYYILTTVPNKDLKHYYNWLLQIAPHNPVHLQALSGQVLFRLTAHFQRNAQFDRARLCLEFAHEKKSRCQAKAPLSLGEAFFGLGNDDRVRSTFEEVSERYTPAAKSHTSLSTRSIS